MKNQLAAIAEATIKCSSCNKHFTEEALGGCFTCSARFCDTCAHCDCDRISEAMEDLTLVANRTGMHAQLLASLKVTLTGLQKLEREAA